MHYIIVMKLLQSEIFLKVNFVGVCTGQYQIEYNNLVNYITIESWLLFQKTLQEYC